MNQDQLLNYVYYCGFEDNVIVKNQCRNGDGELTFSKI